MAFLMTTILILSLGVTVLVAAATIRAAANGAAETLTPRN